MELEKLEAAIKEFSSSRSKVKEEIKALQIQVGHLNTAREAAIKEIRSLQDKKDSLQNEVNEEKKKKLLEIDYNHKMAQELKDVLDKQNTLFKDKLADLEKRETLVAAESRKIDSDKRMLSEKSKILEINRQKMSELSPI